MSASGDWLPNSREDILAMARDWQSVAAVQHTRRKVLPQPYERYLCRKRRRHGPTHAL
jgi:hypothetical protein